METSAKSGWKSKKGAFAPAVSACKQRMAKQSEVGREATLLFNHVARLLLRLGIDAPNAQRTLRNAFVFAAREKARASGGRATQSQIASLAGMSRLEVRSVLAERAQLSKRRESGRLKQLVDAWRTSSAFLDARGRPRTLDLKGPRGSFEHLVRLYGRDVTSKTLRDELIAHGFASLRDGKIQLLGLSDRISDEQIAADADVRFIISQLEGIELHLGRRSYVTRRISVSAHDRKTIYLLKGIASSRLETALSAIVATRVTAPRRRSEKIATRKRLIVSATIATETQG